MKERARGHAPLARAAKRGMMSPVPNPSSENSILLALDIGTSSVRATLYTEAGDEIERSQVRNKRGLCTTSEGGAELNAEEAIEEVAATIDETLRRSPQLAERIATVAVSCFWHSLVGMSRAGQAVTPVFGWADTRAAPQAEALKRRFDERATHTRTGCRFHPSYWPAKILWLREEEPEAYSRTARWLSFGELLASAFFDEAEMSVSMASGTGLLNLRSSAWDEELTAALGISPETLPSIADEHRPFVQLRKSYARRWPQLRAARWFPAIPDGAANNVGAGCTNSSSLALMIGTSGAMRLLLEREPPEDLPPALWCYRLDRRRILVGGALSDGGGLFSWMVDALRLGGEVKELEAILGRMEADAHGLTILPFWAGERSSGWNTAARGAILGLTMHTRPQDILRASMEAVAYRFVLIARALERFAPAAQLIASGGALTASHVWSQILADVLDRPVHLSSVAEASTRGAVLLALEAQGKLKSIIADAPPPLARTFEPDAARHKRYRAGLERQEKLYRQLVADRELATTISAAAQDTEDESEPRCQPSI